MKIPLLGAFSEFCRASLRRASPETLKTSGSCASVVEKAAPTHPVLCVGGCVQITARSGASVLSPAFSPSLGMLFHLLHPFMHDFGLGKSDKWCLAFITQLPKSSRQRALLSQFLRSPESASRSTPPPPTVPH